MQINHPKGVKPRAKEWKLRTGVNWQRVLKQKGMKQGLHVYVRVMSDDRTRS